MKYNKFKPIFEYLKYIIQNIFYMSIYIRFNLKNINIIFINILIFINIYCFIIIFYN